jgi:hypothetical protein
MRLSYRNMSKKLLELHFRMYLNRQDADPLEFLIVSETSALVKHKTRWVTVSIIDLVNWLYATP